MTSAVQFIEPTYMYVDLRNATTDRGMWALGKPNICQACLAPRRTDQARAGRGRLTLEGKLNGKAFANGYISSN